MTLSRGPWPLLFLLAALRPACSSAQATAPAAVRGEVMEAQTSSPLPGAVVRWLAADGG